MSLASWQRSGTLDTFGLEAAEEESDLLGTCRLSWLAEFAEELTGQQQTGIVTSWRRNDDSCEIQQEL